MRLTNNIISTIVVVLTATLIYFHNDLNKNPVDIGWETFATAGVALITIALITVSIQTMKAALTNPVKSLKTE